jgi:hypothetical protein
MATQCWHTLKGVSLDVIRRGEIMTTQVITVGEYDNSILDQAEIDFVDGVSKTGELLQAYADVLCQVFDRKDSEGNTIEKWFNLVGKEKKGINERKASFVQRMINRGYTKGFDKNGNLKASGTVDVYWQRVKEASGYVTKGNRVSGGTDVDSKTVAELKTMINRILKSEEEGKDCTASMFKGQLMEVFEGMGGDVDTLG